MKKSKDLFREAVIRARTAMRKSFAFSSFDFLTGNDEKAGAKAFARFFFSN